MIHIIIENPHIWKEISTKGFMLRFSLNVCLELLVFLAKLVKSRKTRKTGSQLFFPHEIGGTPVYNVHECPHGAIKKTSFPTEGKIASVENISFFSLSQLTLTLLIHFDGEPIFSSSLTLGAFTPSLIHSLIHPTFCSEAHIQQESPIILCRYSSLFVQKLLKQCEQCERWKQ